MEIDLGCPALALVTTQDTAGILRRTSGTRVFGITVVSISRGWAQYRVLQTKDTSFWSFLTFALRGRRFLIFWGAFSGRYFILSMFEGHVRFERIFGKISEHVKAAKLVDIAVPELAVTSLPGLLAASGLVWELHHVDCWRPSSTYPRTRSGSATFWSIFAFFLKQILLPRYFYKNVDEILAPVRELGFFNRLKILLRPRFAKISFKVFFDGFRRF